MDVAKLREAVAAEYKIIPYRQYSERQAAEFLDVDVSTIKRWRREGHVPFIEMPNGGIKYFGFQIVDVLIFGKDVQKDHEDRVGPDLAQTAGLVVGKRTAWPSTHEDPSNVGNGTSVGEAGPPPGTEPATTQPPRPLSVSASAQLTKLLRKID